jgi:hypothetical protein
VVRKQGVADGAVDVKHKASIGRRTPVAARQTRFTPPLCLANCGQLYTERSYPFCSVHAHRSTGSVPNGKETRLKLRVVPARKPRVTAAQQRTRARFGSVWCRARRTHSRSWQPGLKSVENRDMISVLLLLLDSWNRRLEPYVNPGSSPDFVTAGLPPPGDEASDFGAAISCHGRKRA